MKDEYNFNNLTDMAKIAGNRIQFTESRANTAEDTAKWAGSEPLQNCSYFRILFSK